MRVLAIFGPTASGKSAVAEEVARLVPAELVSADAMQVYRGLPMLTNQSEARLVGYLGLDEEGSVADYQRLAHEAVDETLAAGRTARRRRRHGALPARGTGRARVAAATRAGSARTARGALRRAGAGVRRTSCSPSVIRLRPPPCTRTTAAEWCARSSSRRPVRAYPGEDQLWGGETRHPTLIVGLEVPPRGAGTADRGAHEGDVRARGGRRGASRARRPISPTARTIHGLSDVAELPREQAIEAIVIRTRRYAAYQRKWMRRIPGLVPVDASRPPAEVAQEIVDRLGSVAE